MTGSPALSVLEALHKVEAQLAEATGAVERLTRLRDSLREVLDDTNLAGESHSPAATSEAPGPMPESRAALIERRMELGDQIHAMIASAGPGTAWRAGEIARRVLPDNPTRSQVESVRTSAQRLVDKGVLVKNGNASFSLAQGGGASP
jgi:hypothetical protein